MVVSQVRAQHVSLVYAIGRARRIVGCLVWHQRPQRKATTE
jgi:hypothetical protein